VLLGFIALTALPACSTAHQAVRKPAADLGATVAVSGRLVVGLAEGASGWGGASTGPELNRLTSASGARWLREEFLWSSIEPRPGKFTFSYYDHYMLLAARRGVHPIPLLDGTPRWAGATPQTIPSDPTAYAQYVAAVVGRYGPHGSFWTKHPLLRRSAIRAVELWNEPYFDYNNAGDWNPGRYAQLVKAAAIAGRRVDRGAKFLLGAEMASHLNGVWTWWVDGLYMALPSLNRYFDGVAVHDYGTDVTTLPAIVAGRPYGGNGHMRRIEDIRRQFIAHGAAGKPFWIMESGWSTCTQNSVDCVTRAQQAANLKTLFNYLRTRWRNWVQGVFVYRYQDGAHPNTVQDGYGLLNSNGTPKPALAIFRSQAAASSP
jgi:hypothetical protein